MNVQFMILGVGVLCLWQLNVLLSPECIIAVTVSFPQSYL